jgi:hypothetical protein
LDQVLVLGGGTLLVMGGLLDPDKQPTSGDKVSDREAECWHHFWWWGEGEGIFGFKGSRTRDEAEQLGFVFASR